MGVIIDGKLFRFNSSHRKKKRAIEEAERVRKSGLFNARVKKTGFFEWTVYSRLKKRKK